MPTMLFGSGVKTVLPISVVDQIEHQKPRERKAKMTNGLALLESCKDRDLSEGCFCQLSRASLKALDAIQLTAAYPKGAALFQEGESPRGVFVLSKGRVKLSVSSADGKTLILRIATPGEVLGLRSAVSGKPYQATAETLESCQIHFVRREDFLHFLGKHTDAALCVAQQLSSSYEAACEQVRSLGLTNSAPQKLAWFLLKWSGRTQNPQQGARVKLALTHEEIGQMIGASRETVTRTLGEFKHQQLVALKGATLLIQNRPELESLVSA